MAKQKFYVVWNGAEDGVYTSWEACKEAVEGFSGAKYQAFKTEAEAEERAKKVFNGYVVRTKRKEKNDD
jgi:ribonuclease HI